MSPWGSGAEPPTPEERAAWARGEGVEPGEFRTLPAPPPVAPAQRPEPVCQCGHAYHEHYPERVTLMRPKGVGGCSMCSDCFEFSLSALPPAAAREDPFCPQHGPARASDHAAAGCTCRLDAREEPGARCEECGDGGTPCLRHAPPAPSPDVQALVEEYRDALIDEFTHGMGAPECMLAKERRALKEAGARKREAVSAALAALLAAFAAQARRTEEAERDKYCVVETVVKQERELRALQQRLADAEAKLAEAAEDLANATGGFDAAMGLADAEQERAKAAEQRVRDLEAALADKERLLDQYRSRVDTLTVWLRDALRGTGEGNRG